MPMICIFYGIIVRMYNEKSGKLNDFAVFITVRPCGNTIEWVGGQDIAPHELYELSALI